MQQAPSPGREAMLFCIGWLENALLGRWHLSKNLKQAGEWAMQIFWGPEFQTEGKNKVKGPTAESCLACLRDNEENDEVEWVRGKAEGDKIRLWQELGFWLWVECEVTGRCCAEEWQRYSVGKRWLAGGGRRGENGSSHWEVSSEKRYSACVLEVSQNDEIDGLDVECQKPRMTPVLLPWTAGKIELSNTKMESPKTKSRGGGQDQESFCLFGVLLISFYFKNKF